MRIERIKGRDGWRGTITDDENEEVWNGNVTKTIAGAKRSAKIGFVRNKEDQIKDHEKQITLLKKGIEKVKKL